MFGADRGKTWNKLVAIFMGLCILGLLLPSICVGQSRTLKIGVIGPLTGGFTAGGWSQLNGAKLRAKEINEMGGDIKIEILPEDDLSVCSQSINAANKLISKDVIAILGPINSPCTLVTVPVTAKAEVPQFTVSIGTAITRQGSKWIFRVALAADGQTRELANYVVKEKGFTKFAVMNTNDEYGQSAADGFVAALAELGVKPVIVETWTRDDKDYTGQLTRIKTTDAEALFLTGSFTDSALIAKQTRQLGLNVTLLGDTGNATPKYTELGGDAVEGTILVEPFTPADPAPAIQEFVKKFRAEYDKDPDSWSAEFYDAVGIIYEAAKKIPDLDRAKLRDYAASLTKDNPYKGIMGEIYFDEKGDPKYSLYKVLIKDGQKVILTR
ncbi:MAG: ABC transporter substrate-binding protein [Desulfobacterales bacterium]|nr:MAG: ABC transporter substrate-binding protein [Desulfobacterales bacterium]